MICAPFLYWTLAFSIVFICLTSAIFITMDCVAFSTLFPETVFLRGTSQYHATTTSYFAAFENELQPMCVVRPPSAVELGKIVKHLSSLPLHVQVAVKGGGHTAWAGSANIEGGILIDLQSFKGTVVHSDTNTATIAAGERWGDVYAALESKGLAVPGGRVSKVGVSGLVLGGKQLKFLPPIQHQYI